MRVYLFVILLLAFAVPAFAVHYIPPSQQIAIVINGEVQRYGMPPRVVGNRVLVPMRPIFETLGANLFWDSATRTVTAVRSPDSEVQLVIGSTIATVDGRRVALETAPQVFVGTTYVPLRFVSESLGATVRWDPATRQVAISTAPLPPEVVVQPVPPPTGPRPDILDVAVDLKEWEIKLAPTVTTAGNVRFNVFNEGTRVHAFEIVGVKTRLAGLDPGEKGELTVRLSPGVYTVICPIGDHHDRGMTATLTVR